MTSYYWRYWIQGRRVRPDLSIVSTSFAEWAPEMTTSDGW